MKWTTEPPTEPGWYWLMYTCNPKHKQIVLMVMYEGEQSLSCMTIHGEIGINDIDKMYMKWAGPIDEPKEPTE